MNFPKKEMSVVFFVKKKYISNTELKTLRILQNTKNVY